MHSWWYNGDNERITRSGARARAWETARARTRAGRQRTGGETSITAKKSVIGVVVVVVLASPRNSAPPRPTPPRAGLQFRIALCQTSRHALRDERGGHLSEPGPSRAAPSRRKPPSCIHWRRSSSHQEESPSEQDHLARLQSPRPSTPGRPCSMNPFSTTTDGHVFTPCMTRIRSRKRDRRCPRYTSARTHNTRDTPRAPRRERAVSGCPLDLPLPCVAAKAVSTPPLGTTGPRTHPLASQRPASSLPGACLGDTL